MTRRGRRLGICACGALCTGAALAFAMLNGEAAPAKPYTTWSEYAGAADSSQYSALTQINKNNVKQLDVAWFYHVGGEPDRMPFNPLIVNNVMYVSGEKSVVVALDPETGNELWRSKETANERGISYWQSADGTDKRLILNTRGGLREVNATNGELITSFGRDGFVDMRVGSPRRLGGPNLTPPRIFENLAIVGSNVGEGFGSAPGDIRAYDIVTGKLVWTFHTIPRPGEPGYETWPPDAWQYAGSANNWGEMTVDSKNAMVFVPTGSPTADLYGADRAGNDLYGNCLLALDARTGKLVWHFQMVHHDLWDYDNTASPKLLTVKHDGRNVDIVAQAGKTGFLYVFERKTGKPLWPIEERAVPKSEVPGEVSSPTQPFPTAPPPFARQSLKPEEINPYMSADEQLKLKQALLDSAHDGLFTPSSDKRYHLEFPGAWGGANWGSTAADPVNGFVFVRSLEMPSFRKMAVVNRNGRGGGGGEGDGGGRGRGPAMTPPPNGSPQIVKGFGVYAQICTSCHGPGATPMRSPATLGPSVFRDTVRHGRDAMPAFSEGMISNDNLDALEAYLTSLPAGDDQVEDTPTLKLPENPMRYAGPPVVYSGSFSAGWYTSNGLPVSGPPWTQLVAYDLNKGTILWKVPDGDSPGLAEKGIKGTGTVRPRNGPVVTATGIVFVANSQDKMIRAYDEKTGAILWAKELPANPEGIPAIYEVNGRQYIAFAAGASWGTGGDPVWKNAFHRKPSKIEDQGYYVFSLPSKK